MSLSLWRSRAYSNGWQAAWHRRSFGTLARRLATPSARTTVLRHPSPNDFSSRQTLRTNTSHAPTASPAAQLGFVPPLQELTRLRDLIDRLNKTNRPAEKKAILQQYRDLERLLVYVSDPSTRFHLTANVLRKSLEEPDRCAELTDEDLALIDGADLVGMLQVLSERRVTGARAKILSIEFLRRHGIQASAEAQSAELDVLTVFLRVLDRNLKAGIKQRTIVDAFDEADDVEATTKTQQHANSTGSSFMRALDRSKSASSATKRPQKAKQFDFKSASKPRNETTSDALPVALGRTLDSGDAASLFVPSYKWNSPPSPSGSPSWFMSRKLDGIRCIFEVTIACDEYGRPLQTISVRALSRSNNEFFTLAKLTDGISKWACQSAVIGDLIKSELTKKHHLSEEHSRHAKIYLDGELCVLVPEAEGDGAHVAQLDAEDTGDGKHYKEDFAEISKQFRRKDHTIEMPAYFPFDVLTYDEIMHWGNASRQHDALGERLERVAKLVKDFQRLQRSGEQSQGHEQAPLLVRHLEQRRVSTVEEVDKEFAKSNLNNWEGLILRRDCLYEGKRSGSIRKLKAMLDAEYVVTGVEITTMRLAVDRDYAERRALASVLVNHRGTVVNIGSGFTVEQRLRYAEKPELIIGKDITVKYFEESQADKRKGEAQFSLRFPSVKAVFEDGRRQD